MLIPEQNEIEARPNYVVEMLAGTVIAICIAINLFSSNLGFTTLDSKQADGFSGFKMVNVKHHQQPNDLASN